MTDRALPRSVAPRLVCIWCSGAAFGIASVALAGLEASIGAAVFGLVISLANAAVALWWRS